MANPAVIFDAEVRIDQRGITRQVQQMQRGLFSQKNLFNVNTKGIVEPLGQISRSAGEFEKSLAASNARVLAFGASVGIIAGVQQAFKSLVVETVNVEKALADINVILNETDKGLGKFSDSLFDIAKNTGQSFKTAAAAATEFARQGLGAEETLRRVNDSMILVRLSGIDATRAVEGLTAVVNGFAKEALNTTEIINTLANVDAAFAVSTTDLVEALARVGSTAQSAGVGFNELISIVTAAQQITARGGSVIGNSLKSIFTRLQRSSTLDALESLGVATQNANGGFRDGVSLLTDLARSYDTLEDSQKAYVSELVGGVFQINVLKALLGDLGREVSIYSGALDIANKTTDEAIRRNERLNQTIAASVNEVSNSISQLLSTLGNLGAANPIRDIVGIVNDVATSMNTLLGEESGNKIAKGFVKGFGAILSGPAFVSAAIIAVRLFSKTALFAAKSLKNILGVASETERVHNLQISINAALAEAGTSYNAILAGSRGVVQAEQKVLEILRQQNALRKGSIGTNVAAPLYQRGVRVAKDTGIFKNLAGGSDLAPTIMRESRAIDRGIGGATKAAKPVVVPNFNFGKGKKGTVVANTDEVIVPNFGGSGGDAVFNRSMISKYGMPKGATKIAARGTIPNFALPPNEVRPGEVRRADFLSWFHGLSDQDIFGLEFEKKDGTLRSSSYKRSFDVKSLQRKGQEKKFYSKDIPFNLKRVPLIDFNKLQKNKKDPKFNGDNQEILKNSFSQASLANIRNLSTGGKHYKVVDAARGFIPNFAGNVSKGFGGFELGRGSFGSVYGGKGRLSKYVEKTFDGEAFIRDPKLRNKERELIRREYLISKLAEKEGLPIAKVAGSLGRSMDRGTIVKERVNGPTGLQLRYKLDDYKYNGAKIVDSFQEKLKKAYEDKGINPSDLSILNFMFDMPMSKIDRKLSGPDYPGKIQDLLKELQQSAKVVDPGLFYTKDLRFGDFSRGFIPNFMAKKKNHKYKFRKNSKGVSNIENTYNQTDRAEYFGRAYEEYHNLASKYSKDLGIPLEKFATIFAKISPSNPVERNILDTISIIQAHKAGLGPKDVSIQTFDKNKEQAFAFLRGEKNLTGVKRSAFADNILNPFASKLSTIDFRATGIYAGRKYNAKSAPSLNKDQNQIIQDAYAEVANRKNVLPLNVQAATWVHDRKVSGRDSQGFNRALLDKIYKDGIPERNGFEFLKKNAKDIFKRKSQDQFISIAKGFVPNFANPAINEAIARELKATGLPKSQIKLESDASLASRFNPFGLGVTNTRDEPNGIGQGIARAKMSGIDPKKHGIAVPNFAKKSKGQNKIQGLNELPETIFDEFLKLLKITRSPNEETSKAAFIRSSNFAAPESKALNKKLLEDTIVPALKGAVAKGGDAITTELERLAPEIKKIETVRAKPFSVKGVVGDQSTGERAINSIKRKFAKNPNVGEFLGKAKGDPVTVLNSLLKQAKDPERGLPPQHEIKKQIQSAVKGPSVIRRYRQERFPVLSVPPAEVVDKIPSRPKEIPLDARINRVGNAKKFATRPPTFNQFSEAAFDKYDLSKDLNPKSFKKTSGPVPSFSLDTIDNAFENYKKDFYDAEKSRARDIESQLSRGITFKKNPDFKAQTISEEELVPPRGKQVSYFSDKGPLRGGDQTRGPSQPPPLIPPRGPFFNGPNGPDNPNGPNFPDRFGKRGKKSVRQPIKITALEKALGKNLEDVISKQLNIINDQIQNTTIPSFPAVGPQKPTIPAESKSRFTKTQDVRSFLNQDASRNLANPAFYNTITNLSRTSTIEESLISKVQNQVLKGGKSVEDAMKIAQAQILKFEQITPERMQLAIVKSADTITNFSKDLAQKKYNTEAFFKAKDAVKQESSIFLKAEKESLGKKDIQALRRIQLQRTLNDNGVESLSLLSKERRRQIGKEVTDTVNSNILSRTSQDRYDSESKRLGFIPVNGAKPEKPKGAIRRGLGKAGGFIKSDQFTNAAFLGSFALSGASGLAGDNVGGSLLQGAGVGASFGLFGGGPGIVAGALIGGVIGAATKAIDGMVPSLKKLDEKFQEINSTFQKNIEAANLFVRTQSDLREAIERGASSTQISTLKDQLIEQFSSIRSPALRNDLLANSGNTDKQIQAIEINRREGQKEIAKLNTRALFRSVNDENGAFGVGRTQANIVSEWADKVTNFVSGVQGKIPVIGDYFNFIDRNIKSAEGGIADFFGGGKRLSLDQVDRLARGTVDSKGLLEAGTGKNAEADKFLAKITEAFNSIDTPEGIGRFTQALEEMGLTARESAYFFTDTTERLAYLSKVLDFTKEAQASSTLAETMADVAVNTAGFINELKKLDRIFAVQNEIRDLERKSQDALDIQKKRSALNITGRFLSPTKLQDAGSAIDYKELINQQTADRQAETRKQSEALRSLLNTGNKFTRTGIESTLKELQNLEANGESIIPLLEQLTNDQSSKIFEEGASETIDKLQEILIESYRSNEIQNISQDFARKSFEESQKLQKVLTAQKSLEGAIGGRDPLDIAKAIFAGETNIADIIKPFQGVAQSEFIRRQQENSNFINPSYEGNRQLENDKIREAIAKLDQFKFLENVVGINPDQIKGFNEARKTVANTIFGENTKNQINTTEIARILGNTRLNEINRSIDSRDPKSIQREIDRLNNVFKNGSDSTEQNASKSAAGALEILKEAITNVNDNTAFVNEIVSGLGGKSTLTDIVGAISSSESSVSQGLIDLKNIFAAQQTLADARTNAANIKAEKQKLGVANELKVSEITNIKKETPLNTALLEKQRNVTGGNFARRQNITVVDPIKDLPKELQSVLEGFRNGQFRTIEEAAIAITSPQDQSGRFKDISGAILEDKKSISLNSVIDFLYESIGKIPGLLDTSSGQEKKISELDASIQTNIELINATQESTEANIEVAAAIGELNKALGAKATKDAGKEFVDNFTNTYGSQGSQDVGYLGTDLEQQARKRLAEEDGKRMEIEAKRQQAIALKAMEFNALNRGPNGSYVEYTPSVYNQNPIPSSTKIVPKDPTIPEGYQRTHIFQPTKNGLQQLNEKYYPPSLIPEQKDIFPPEINEAISNIQKSISDLTAIQQASVNATVTQILELKGEIVKDNNVTPEEIVLINATLKNLKDGLEELRRQNAGRAVLPK